MALAATQPASPPAPPRRSGWILDRKSDLFCFVLSPLYSMFLLGLFLTLTRVFHTNVQATERTFFLWFLILFDRPHIVQTFARTHFDPVERKRHAFFHWWFLGAVLIYTTFWPGFSNQDAYKFLFALFGTWHIFAQNMGFLKLYGRLDG